MTIDLDQHRGDVARVIQMKITAISGLPLPEERKREIAEILSTWHTAMLKPIRKIPKIPEIESPTKSIRN